MASHRLQEERDRRVNDLKSQLNQCEKEMEEMRRRQGDRLQSLEKEWHSEVDRLKKMHNNNVKKLIEQHEQDIARIRKIKEQEIESVNSLQNHGLSLDHLLGKWEASAQQIETLHKSVIAKQEQILKEKFVSLETKDKKFDAIEINWNSLINELEKERNKMNLEQKKLSEIIEEQKSILQNEQKQIIQERFEIENKKREFENEKKQFILDQNYAQENFNKSKEQFQIEYIKLKEEKAQFEEDKRQQNIKELEWKHEMQKEKNDLDNLFGEIEQKRIEINKQQSQLQISLFTLQNEQHQFEQKKIKFDNEKVKLQELANVISKRAEELEGLSEITMQERQEGNAAMDEAERLKLDLDERLQYLERTFNQLKKEEENINKSKKSLDEQWKILKETKDELVCSLCGSGLSKGKPMKSCFKDIVDNKFQFLILAKLKANFYDFNQFYNQNNYPQLNELNGIQESEKALLIWQITAQQDAALLAEETAFVNAIRNTSDMNFQNHFYK